MEKDAIIDKYDRIAMWFLKRRSRGDPPMEREYLEALTEALPEGARVLDLGCGGGEPIAGYCIRRGHPVIGLDGSPRMIAACRRRFPDMPWIVGDMRAIPLGERCRVGAVIAWDSFFHLDHAAQRALFPVFAQLLRPGGQLLFTAGPGHGRVVGTMAGLSFAHYSLSREEYAALLSCHGFTVRLHRVEDPECGGHTVWLARLDDAPQG